jgi:hypothetical protein
MDRERRLRMLEARSIPTMINVLCLLSNDELQRRICALNDRDLDRFIAAFEGQICGTDAPSQQDRTHGTI